MLRLLWQRFGDSCLLGLVWQLYTNQKPYNAGRFMVMAATYLQKKYKFEANLGILQLFYNKWIFFGRNLPRFLSPENQKLTWQLFLAVLQLVHYKLLHLKGRNKTLQIYRTKKLQMWQKYEHISKNRPNFEGLALLHVRKYQNFLFPLSKNPHNFVYPKLKLQNPQPILP